MDMSDKITGLFDKYKEATRNFWNIYITNDGNGTWEDFEIFSEISELLFEAVVLKPLGIDRSKKVDVKFKLRAKSGNCIPLMVNRTGDGGGWDHPVTALINDEYDIEFIDYFDWDQLGIKDNRYFTVKILVSKNHPEINGFKALIETQYVDVYAEKICSF